MRLADSNVLDTARDKEGATRFSSNYASVREVCRRKAYTMLVLFENEPDAAHSRYQVLLALWHFTCDYASRKANCDLE